MGQTIGYARVSTLDQDVSLQLDALRQAGCADDQIFLDVASGTYPTRPGLTACLQALEGVLKIPVDVCKATYTKMSFADFTEIERLSHLVKRARIVRKCSFQEFSNTLLGKMRRKLPQLELALTGQFTPHHGRIIQGALDLIDLLNRQIAEIDEQVGALVAPLQPQIEQLGTIPGVEVTAARLIIAETGTDMSRFGSHTLSGQNTHAALRW